MANQETDIVCTASGFCMSAKVNVWKDFKNFINLKRDY